MLISHRVQTIKITKDILKLYVMIKGLIYKDSIITLNVYVLNNRAFR